MGVALLAGIAALAMTLLAGAFFLLFKGGFDFSGPNTCDNKYYPLQRAAARGDLEGINRALDEGTDPNGGDGQLNTPLGCAAPQGQTEAVAVLLARGADANRPTGDPKGNYAELPLELALNRSVPAGGNAAQPNRLVTLLLDHGADPNRHTAARHPLPLVTALKSDDVALAQLLLDRGAGVNGTADDTPLVELAADSPKVTWLLDHGADPNGRPGHRPLVSAAGAGMFGPASFEALLQRGADPAVPFDETTAETTADRALAAAAGAGDPVRLQRLLDLSADPNRSDAEHDALLAAVAAKKIDLVTLLLDVGADPNHGRYDPAAHPVNSTGPWPDLKPGDGSDATVESVQAALGPINSFLGTSAPRSTVPPGAAVVTTPTGHTIITPLNLAVGLGDTAIADLLRSRGAT